MILSAMLIALGAMLSGLVWLALTVALVRRARRLTERRLLAAVSTRRAEFDAERDEMRARHAVEMHQREREVGRVLDLATAYRLEAEVKDLELGGMRAEFVAREEEIRETEARLTVQRELVQELERRHAEAGAALRATRHSLKLERRRRTAAEEALEEAEALAEERRAEAAALRAENVVLRAALGDRLPDGVDATPVPEPSEVKRLPAARMPIAEGAADMEPEPLQQGGSVVPLRPRAPSADPALRPDVLVAQATRNLQRLAGAASAETDEIWRATAGERTSGRQAAEADGVLRLDAHRPTPAGEHGLTAEDEEAARSRFYEALSEIRATKRPIIQAGE
jgi:hypothetical protein